MVSTCAAVLVGLVFTWDYEDGEMKVVMDDVCSSQYTKSHVIVSLMMRDAMDMRMDISLAICMYI